MTNRKRFLGLLLSAALMAPFASFSAAATKTLTGVITDDMCGKKHTMMPGKPDTDCIRACVKAGSKYALLVGDKMYLLKGDAKRLDQLAGKKVRVSGDVNGTTVAVTGIAESK